MEKIQALTIWPDGSEETINFVDQRADGTATLTTYINYSTDTEPKFHDDMYCTASWSGCSVFTAPDDNDGRMFDGSFNFNCPGARSLSDLVSSFREYGECGRREARLNVRQKIGLLHSGVEATAFGRHGLLWQLGPSNTDIRARNVANGLEVPIPLYGATVEVFASRHREPVMMWLDDPMLASAMRDYARRLDNELKTEQVEVTITYNGVPLKFTVAGGAHPVANSSLWRARANRSF